MISSDKVAQELAVKPNCDRCTIFDENLIAVHMRKTKLYFIKPVYLDMSVLDLSKSLMNDFHYNYVKTKYGDKRKIPINLLRIIEYWFSKSFTCVRWGSQYSQFYKQLKGVRHGGALSPCLFCNLY